MHYKPYEPEPGIDFMHIAGTLKHLLYNLSRKYISAQQDIEKIREKIDNAERGYGMPDISAKIGDIYYDLVNLIVKMRQEYTVDREERLKDIDEILSLLPTFFSAALSYKVCNIR